MSQQNETPNPFDPMGFWRTTQNVSLEAWSKAMIELVNTEAYTQATGRLLDTYLAASVPMRKVVEQAMAQVLGHISMPTRGEVLSIAERMTNIEMRLDDLDARFDELTRTLTQIADQVSKTEKALAAPAKRQSKSDTTAATANNKNNKNNTQKRQTRASSAAGRTSAASRTKE